MPIKVLKLPIKHIHGNSFKWDENELPKSNTLGARIEYYFILAAATNVKAKTQFHTLGVLDVNSSEFEASIEVFSKRYPNKTSNFLENIMSYVGSQASNPMASARSLKHTIAQSNNTPVTLYPIGDVPRQSWRT
jgi:hypothetical protein